MNISASKSISSQLTKALDDESFIKEWDDILMQPLSYFREKPCFNRHTKFYESINHWVSAPNDKIAKIREIVEMTYSDTIMFDDIQDNTTLRKGRKAAHIVHGEPFTLNSIKMSLFVVLQKVRELCSDEGVAAYNKYMLKMVRGSGAEIYWRDNFICPVESDYLKIALFKNFEFLNFQARLVQLCGNSNQDFSTLTALVATFYMVHNDYSDFIVSDYSEGKNFCDDLIEGKFNFPTIHAIKMKNCEEVARILQQKTRDVSLKLHYVQLLEDLGSLQHTRDYLFALYEEITQEIKRLGGNPYFEREFEGMMKAVAKAKV